MSPGAISYLAPNLRLWRRLADGKHTAEVEGEALVVEGSFYNGPIISRQPLKVEATWTLHAADVPTVHAVDNPSYRAAVEKAIRVGHDASYFGAPYGPPRIEVSNNGYADIRIIVAKPPVNLAYKIILRAGSEQWGNDAGVYCPAGSGMTWGTECRVPGLSAHQVDVVLRPSAGVAARSFDLTSYWNGELVFHNVRVDYEKPTAKPATRAATIRSPAAKR